MPLIKRITRILLTMLLLLPAAAPAASSAAPVPSETPGCAGTVRFGTLTWESGAFTTALLRQIAEKGYGCATEETPGAAAALENALLQNDIQVIAEVWDGRSPALEQGISDGRIRVVGDTLEGGARQGWYIPDYTAAQYPDLKSIADLKRYAHLFPDPANPKKARFLNCPSGWVCEVFNTRLLENFGLGRYYGNTRSGTGAALDAEISAHYQQKKPLLFYYWQPAGLMAKHRFTALEAPPYDKRCWDRLLDKKSRDACVSGFPVSRLKIAVAADFGQKYPQLAELFGKIRFTPDELNRAVLEMTEHKRSAAAQAQHFLRRNPDRWRQWVSPEAAVRLQDALSGRPSEKAAVPSENPFQTASDAGGLFPAWSAEEVLNRGVKRLVQGYGGVFRQISAALQNGLLNPAERLLGALPAWLVILSAAALAWHGTRRLPFALGTAAALFLIGALGMWQALMSTVSLMAVAVSLTVLLGIPAGIVLAKYPRAYRAALPLMDVMQTMPSFVYLIPVLMLFGLGKVPAVFACIVYAVVPLVRLTVLGIRQISPELLEAGVSFGSSRSQMLRWIVLPLAKPQIMAGVNQTVMMSLSMVVLASMIGATGLGELILQAIQTLNVGQGLQAGGAVAALAVIVDRITQGYGKAV